MNTRPNAYIAATKPDKVKDDGIQPIFDFIKSWFKKPEPAFEPTLDLTATNWEAMPEAIHDNDVYLLNTEDGKYQIGEIYGAENAQLVVNSPRLYKAFDAMYRHIDVLLMNTPHEKVDWNTPVLLEARRALAAAKKGWRV